MSVPAVPAGHFLLGERAGWREAQLDRVDAQRVLTLRTRPGSARPLADADGTFGGFTAPTGVAVAPDGRVYVLDAGAQVVKVFDPCTETFATLPCLGGRGERPRQLQDPHGIAVSSRGDLFVADTGNRRVQVFSLKGLALRAILDDVGEPWDVAVGPNCRVYVSDRENGVIHVFGAHGHHDVLDVPLRRPLHVAVDRDGRVYVVEEGAADVVAISPDGTTVERVQEPDRLSGRFCASGIAVDDDGNLCVGALAFDRAGNALVLDGNRRVCTIERASVFESDGRLIAGPLDSRVYHCEWHRVQMEASVPVGTAVRVEAFTSEADKPIEEVAGLTDERWSPPYTNASTQGNWDCLIQSPPGRYLWLRLTLIGGSDTPVVRKVKVYFPRASSLRFLPAVYGEDPQARDFTTRFLSIFDTVRDSVAQRIDTLAALFDPRATPAGGDGGDALQWLGSWLGLALDPRLPVSRRRALVRHAHALFKRRGTPDGLRAHLALYTGVEPLVLEHFKLRRWLFVGEGRLGDRSALFGDAIVRRLQLDRFSRIGDFALLDAGDPLHDPFHVFAHQFTVFVPARCAPDNGGRAAIEQVVELAKPAHTEGVVELVEPRFRIGIQSLLGLDTVVGAYPDAVVEGTSRIGFDSVLGVSADEAQPPSIRLGIRSRIASNTVID